MELKVVSYETAKELKDIGFDLICHVFYIQDHGLCRFGEEMLYLIDKDDSVYDCNEEFEGFDIVGKSYAPTLALVQTWFRKIYNIDIEVNKEDFNTTLYYSATIYGHDFKYTNADFDTALEIVIKEAIRLINLKLWNRNL